MHTKPIPEFSKAEQERFWATVEKGASCWIWQGRPQNSKGYGCFYAQGQNFRSHRVAYTLAHGRIPDGLVLDHICRTRACVNPAHLRAVTNKVNVTENSRSFSAANVVKDRCSNGHLFTPENTRIYRAKGRTSRSCRICSSTKTRAALKAMREAAINGETT